MLMPTVGQKVKIAAINLKPGMYYLHAGDRVLIEEVDIELTEYYAVSVVYADESGKSWGTYFTSDQLITVEYAKGQNIVSIV